jgi:hypothetical protein
MIRVENLVKKYGDFTAVNERSVTKPRAASTRCARCRVVEAFWKAYAPGGGAA